MRHTKIFQYTMAILFIAYVGGLILFNVLMPDRDFSESENRRLEPAPSFSWRDVFQGKFTTSYEKYIADQFSFRDLWVGLKSDSERALGKKDSNGVFLGKDGYLFQKFSKPEVADIKEKATAINSFAEATPGARLYFMMVPTAIKVMEEKLPRYAPVDDQLLYLEQVKSALNSKIRFVDVFDSLYSKKQEYLFYRTDHHWTTQGAFYAYEKLARDMELPPHERNYYDVKKVSDSFYGTLYSKGSFRHLVPDDMELYIPKTDEGCKVEYVEEHKNANTLYEMDNLNKKDKYTVFFGGNHPLLKITTRVPGGKKLLVVKDSYANCFIPFLTGHFSEIYVVDLRYYNENTSQLVNQNNIQDVLILYNENSFFEDDSINNISS